MSNIESALSNFKVSHNLLLKAAEQLRHSDEKVRSHWRLFSSSLIARLRRDHRAGRSIQAIGQDIWKHYYAALDIQQDKNYISETTYNKIDTEVNAFDNELLLYMQHKAEAKLDDAAIQRVISLNKKGKKASRQLSIGEDEVRESVDEPAPNIDADPSEPRYCHCQRVAFGRMVACDNAGCPYEWFHFVCVGLDDDPSNDWYCADCEQQRLQLNTPSSVSSKKSRTTKNDRLSEPKVSSPKLESVQRKSLSALKRLRHSVSPDSPTRKRRISDDCENTPKRRKLFLTPAVSPIKLHLQAVALSPNWKANKR